MFYDKLVVQAKTPLSSSGWLVGDRLVHTKSQSLSIAIVRLKLEQRQAIDVLDTLV